MSLTTQTYWAEHALVDLPRIDRAAEPPGTADRGTVEPGVVIVTAADGRITEVRPGAAEPPVGAVSLRGLTIPGLANTHSHAFHRALRGTVQVGSGTFWTWREAMYQTASRLTPDSYFELARAVYAEMALAGITCVGEFHYVHHAPGGTRYNDPNAMGKALVAAAAEAGIRITLLDTCYLAAGFGQAPNLPQLRFSDGTAAAWAERADALAADVTAADQHARVGAAIHSVRAVPADEMATVAGWARRRQAPLHVHLSEQPAENEECRHTHGRTPARLLADHGVLGAGTTAVHATHLTGQDIELLGGTGTGVCLCPTTERDLADGVGPAARLGRAGSPLSLGSDSHAVIDLLEEARAMELDERLLSRVRGHWTAGQLLDSASLHGHAALGWPEAGRLEPGALADFSTIALNSVRTAGTVARLATETAVFAATNADVRHTIVAGRHIVRDGLHQLVPQAASALSDSIAALRRDR